MQVLATLKKIFDKVDADDDIKKKAFDTVVSWLEDDTLAPYHPYISNLIEREAGEALLDAFWRMIPFGTGGRRGPVGAGPNRINPHTVALSVQGHCDYLRQVVGLEGDISVVVAHDVREFFDLRGVYPGVDGVLKNLTSREMAKVSAQTYAANGVTAFVVGPLQDEPDAPACKDRFISTPELSFLIRALNAAGGLNISASHNHPDDNGGKFYNAEGGQEIPPDDERLLNVVEKVTTIKTIPYLEARRRGLIRFVPETLHREYIEMNKALCPTESRSAIPAYTPLNGTGVSTVGEALLSLGYQLHCVPEQMPPDGSFEAVRYRIGNPEVPDSMDRLREVAVEKKCDIGFSSDPDADRLGMIVPNSEGDYVFIGGNEIGVLLVESILQTRKRNGTFPDNPFFANTLVTTSLQRHIAEAYGCQVIGDLMVGCKYMANVIKEISLYGKYPRDDTATGCDTATGTLDDYIFSCEESHGYLVSHRVRDKDACGAAVHLAGLASMLKDKNKSILGMLNDIYRVYGYFANKQRALVMEGIVGLRHIARIQKALRENPPKRIAGREVVGFVDSRQVGGPIQSGTDASSRNVLLFELDNGKNAPIRLIVRPSGTEPKTKIYVEVSSGTPIGGTLLGVSDEALRAISEEMLASFKAEADSLAEEIGTAFVKYCLGAEVLGRDFPEVPEASLLISDLIPVEHKIRLIRELLPETVRRLEDNAPTSSIERWLRDALKPFGEEPLPLIKKAVSFWISKTCHNKARALVHQMEQLFLL